MEFDIFKQFYDELSDSNQMRVFYLLQNLEHSIDDPDDKDKVDYSRGFKIALKGQGMSINNLADEIEEKYRYQEVRNSIASLIMRGSRKSEYLKEVLEILEIDETYLIKNSEYFLEKTRSIEWCFTHLSPQNQEAVYMLTLSLLSDDFVSDSLLAECNNVGVSPVDDLPL